LKASKFKKVGEESNLNARTILLSQISNFIQSNCIKSGNAEGTGMGAI